MAYWASSYHQGAEASGQRPAKRTREGSPSDVAFMMPQRPPMLPMLPLPPTPQASTPLVRTAQAVPPPPMIPGYQQQLEADLQSLSGEAAKQLLLQYAPLLPALARGVMDKCHSQRLQEMQVNRNYDSYPKEVDYILNNKYSQLSSSKLFEISGDVELEIEELLKRMVADIQPHSSYESKYNAAENMLRIFEEVMDSDDELRHELHQNCHGWDELFLKLFACFTVEELRWLAVEPVGYRKHAWSERLRLFVGEARALEFVEGVDEAYDRLQKSAPEA
ncbi:uncharacterized protein PG986_010581 [Apiospora aurea]|uniref:Uncharacterized protein n=1 Tax=Apiospora aurea TaxID=335848 RepID=A0ABR1Q2M8_9PEZI